MIHQIGSLRRRPPDDIVDALLECHGRIRQFAELGARLAGASDPAVDDVRQTAARVRRYFDEALPLHVADEEHTVVPRLRGLDPSIDAALEQMRREHSAHEAAVAALIAACRELESTPERHRRLRDHLGEVTASLERDFSEHLALEESIIIPAIAGRLGAEERAAMLGELRARRKDLIDART